MASWDPTQRLPDQIFDAFADMYDWLGQRHIDVIRRASLMDAVRRHHDIHRLISAAGKSDWTTPLELRACISESLNGHESNTALAVYACLHAIDEGLGFVHPGRKPSPEHRFVRRFDTHGRYNDATDGYVLPSWARPERGVRLADFVRWFTRANVPREFVHLVHDPDGYEPNLTDRSPVVAVVPFLYRLDLNGAPPDADLRLLGIDRTPRHYFTIEHLHGSGVDLVRRIGDAVRLLRDQGVEIAIFPELALNAELLMELRSALKREALAHGKGSLIWVIAGCIEPRLDTDSVVPIDFPVYNAAIVLDAYGNTVGETVDMGEPGWRQRKRHAYELSLDEQVDMYGIGHLFSPLEAREEAISIGSSVTIFQNNKGRFAIAICEDFGQELHTVDFIREMGCTALFVLLMDGPVAGGRWAPAKARTFAAQTGTIPVLANSLVLPTLPKPLSYGRRPSAGKAPRIPVRLAVGYMVLPKEKPNPPSRPQYLESFARPRRRNLVSSRVFLRRR